MSMHPDQNYEEPPRWSKILFLTGMATAPFFWLGGVMVFFKTVLGWVF